MKPQIPSKIDFEPFRIGGSDISENPAAIYSKSERPNRPSVLKADVEGAREGRNGRSRIREAAVTEWPNSE